MTSYSAIKSNDKVIKIRTFGSTLKELRMEFSTLYILNS